MDNREMEKKKKKNKEEEASVEQIKSFKDPVNRPNDRKEKKKKKKNKEEEASVEEMKSFKDPVNRPKDRKKEKKKKKQDKGREASVEEVKSCKYDINRAMDNKKEKMKKISEDVSLVEIKPSITASDRTDKSKKEKKNKNEPLIIPRDESVNTQADTPSLQRSDGKEKKRKKSSIVELDTVGNELEKHKEKKRRKKKEADEVVRHEEAIPKERQTDSTCKENRKKNEKKSSIAREGAPDSADVPNESGMKSKRVSFSQEVKVISYMPPKETTAAAVGGDAQGSKLVQGKRFSEEEDNLIKQSVEKYIKENSLGENGLEMVLNCGKHPQLRGCWKEIGESLPWRPTVAVYNRAHTLYERGDKHKWEPHEYETVLRFYEEHGAKWKTLATMLGRNRNNVKDTWRRKRLPNLKQGRWSQDEYQKLFDLVNLDFKLRSLEEKKSKHGMLRDNIHWDSICLKLETRHQGTCCTKWYDQLTSSLVRDGLWSDSDDYRLIEALQNQDACCIEDVEWDDLVENRSGETCKKRWTQMTRHIGGVAEKTFIEQVELLSQRYCPEMLEYRK